jgi:hypothetical protein
MVELLVTIFVSGVTLASAVTFWANHARVLRASAFRLEAQQALRGSLDAITRDLRLAGACLPLNGQAVALAGVNAPGGDSITIRTGLTRADLSCILASTDVAVGPGALTLQMDPAIPNVTDGFATDMLAYIADPPNAIGEFATISAVGPNSITFDTALTQAYPRLSTVYAVDERTYAIDASIPTLPLLTLQVDRGMVQAFAAGMRDLQIQYVLDQNCPPCDRVNLPVSNAQWRLVNSVELTATVETVGGIRPQDQATIVATSEAKPRNLLP